MSVLRSPSSSTPSQHSFVFGEIVGGSDTTTCTSSSSSISSSTTSSITVTLPSLSSFPPFFPHFSLPPLVVPTPLASSFDELLASLHSIPFLPTDPLRFVCEQQYFSPSSKGLWLECGVGLGNSIRCMAHYRAVNQNQQNNRPEENEEGNDEGKEEEEQEEDDEEKGQESKKNDIVYGFDSFDGLPSDWRPGFPRGCFSLNSTAESLASFSALLPGNVHLVKGLFADSLPRFFAGLSPQERKAGISLLHIDCDLYASTVTVLQECEPFIHDETVLVFDELFNYPSFEQHEVKALWEFCHQNKRSIQWIGRYGTVDDRFLDKKVGDIDKKVNKEETEACYEDYGCEEDGFKEHFFDQKAACRLIKNKASSHLEEKTEKKEQQEKKMTTTCGPCQGNPVVVGDASILLMGNYLWMLLCTGQINSYHVNYHYNKNKNVEDRVRSLLLTSTAASSSAAKAEVSSAGQDACQAVVLEIGARTGVISLLLATLCAQQLSRSVRLGQVHHRSDGDHPVHFPSSTATASTTTSTINSSSTTSTSTTPTTSTTTHAHFVVAANSSACMRGLMKNVQQYRYGLEVSDHENKRKRCQRTKKRKREENPAQTTKKGEITGGKVEVIWLDVLNPLTWQRRCDGSVSLLVWAGEEEFTGVELVLSLINYVLTCLAPDGLFLFACAANTITNTSITAFEERTEDGEGTTQQHHLNQEKKKREKIMQGLDFLPFFLACMQTANLHVCLLGHHSPTGARLYCFSRSFL